MKHISDIIQTY